MDVNDLAVRLDDMSNTLHTSIKNQAVLETEMKLLGKTMERFAEMLEKQIEQDNKINNMRADLEIAFTQIKELEHNGTRLCGLHNTQFAEYNEQSKSRSNILNKEINELNKEVAFRWDEVMTDLKELKTDFKASCDAKSSEIDKVKETMDKRFKSRDDRAWKLALVLFAPVYGGLVAMIFALFGG